MCCAMHDALRPTQQVKERPAHAKSCRHRRRHRRLFAGRRADRARLHRRHRARPRAAVHHRRVDLARARAGVPDQPVEDDDARSPLHRREIRRLEHPDGWAFNPVGGLEVATTPERWADLHRKAGWAAAGASQGELARRPRNASTLHPLLDGDRILGGFHTPTDGLAKARARRRGAGRDGPSPAVRRSCRTPRCSASSTTSGRVVGVRTATGDHRRRHRRLRGRVLGCAAGQAGRPRRPAGADGAPVRDAPGRSPRSVGRNTELSEAGLPILRHQDQDLYFREHVDRLGIGSYGHRPMPVDMSTLMADTAGEPMPSMLPFTDEDFAPAWAASAELLPALGDSKVEEAFNGIFSFTPDGFSIMGEHRELSGFWVAEAVWVTHSAGRRQGHRRVDRRRHARRSTSTNATCTASRTSPAAPSSSCRPARRRSSRSTTSSIRTSTATRCAACGSARSTSGSSELGAFFFEGAGWERPAWYEANAALAQRLRADGTGRSPSATTGRRSSGRRSRSPRRTGPASASRMYDMTPLTRYEVAGRGAAAFLQRMTTNNVDKSVGSVTYTLLLDETGGIRSDLTVARLADDRFQVGVNGPMDFDWFSSPSARRWRHRARHHRRHLLHRRVGAAGPRPGGSRCAPTTSRTRRSSTSAPCRPTSAPSPSPCCGSPTSASWAGRSTPAPNTVPRCGTCCSRRASATA